MMGEKRGMKALELWCRRVTEGYPGVKIENMTTSWRDGLAFCALIHHFRPDLIDFDGLDKRDIYKNNELAFRVAERQLGIPALLDAEDMVEYEVPDRLSILTYLSQFYQTFVSNQQGSTSPSSRSHSTKVPEMISTSTKTQKTPKVGAGRLESCWSCRRPVFLAERLVAGGKLRHRTCFTCTRCGHQLSPIGYYETEGGYFVCETCPDEEEQKQINFGGGEGLHPVHSKDEYSLDFASALESILQSKGDISEMKSSHDMVGNSQLEENFPGTTAGSALGSVDVSFTEERSVKNVSFDSVNDNQYPTANRKNLNLKIKNLLGRDFSDTLSLLNKESDSFIVDITEIIDNIINDAVKKAENRVEESLNNELDSPLERKERREDMTGTAKENVFTGYSSVSDKIVQEAAENNEEKDEAKSEIMDDSKEEENNYPEDLNPFASDEDDAGKGLKLNEMSLTPTKIPLPMIKPRSSHFNQSGQKILEAPKVNLNPFWSDGEPSSDEDVTKPVPAPRTSLRTPEHSPFSRSEYGSFTSLSSIGSSASALRRKKGPAPLPPSGFKSPNSPSSPDCRSPQPISPARSHRKLKPAPSPPTGKFTDNGLIPEKKDKDCENRMKSNLSIPDKSSFGKWKRKKGQAPGLPIPQRRRITPLPMPEVNRELEDLEIQQRELERQGVTVEQTIREYECEAAERGEEESEEGGRDVEGLILQLFEIVNQKNELFRRQAELMLLRRQQRLEEEHADIEYQIRCLMGRPERNKTDSDKAQEEELIRRLVEVVERRNEIIECLDMDRKREVEEDESIHHHLEAFAGKARHSQEKSKSNAKNSSSLLKYIKKKKSKKEKTKEAVVKSGRGGGKAVYDLSKDEDVKTLKPKKIWFPKA